MNFKLFLERLKNEPEWVVLGALVLLIGIGGGVFYYYQHQQESQEAERRFRRAVTIFNQADRTGNYQQARSVLRRYVNNHGGSAYGDKAHFFLGKTYYQTGQYVSAIKQFRQVRDRDPNSFFAESSRLYIGYSNLERNKPQQAKRTLRELTRDAGDHPIWVEAQWQLALLEYRLGNIESAASSLDRLLESDRDIEEFWRNWAKRLRNRLTAQS